MVDDWRTAGLIKVSVLKPVFSTIHQETEAVATRAWTEGRIIYLELTDQRIIGFPADRFRRLQQASEAECGRPVPPGATKTPRAGFVTAAVFYGNGEVLREGEAESDARRSPHRTAGGRMLVAVE